MAEPKDGGMTHRPINECIFKEDDVPPAAVFAACLTGKAPPPRIDWPKIKAAEDAAKKAKQTK